MRRPTRLRTLTVILAVLSAVLVCALVWGSVALIGAFNDRDDAIRAATSAVTTNKDAAETACKQVEQTGKTCAVDPSKLQTGKDVVESVPGVQGIQGVPGPAGPPGGDGKDGQDGRTPTRAQLEAILTRLCGGSCKGEPGTSVKGEKGDSVKGDPGSDAPRVTSVNCAEDGTLTFRFDDDSTIAATGSCRGTILAPPPEE